MIPTSGTTTQPYSLVITGGLNLAGPVGSDGNQGTCSLAVLCPNSCTNPRQGTCMINTNVQPQTVPSGSNAYNTPDSTLFYPSSVPSTLNTNTGFCLCSGNYVGADCSITPYTIDGPWTSLNNLQITSGSWTYVAYNFNPAWDLQLSVTIVVQIAYAGQI